MNYLIMMTTILFIPVLQYHLCLSFCCWCFFLLFLCSGQSVIDYFLTMMSRAISFTNHDDDCLVVLSWQQSTISSTSFTGPRPNQAAPPAAPPNR
mmetsp:Transcript_126164/g.288801  ORF Transcript_126164/g.288801 Transcript_126164/m.288801 type:complete len:95 (-) Transcript_126164:38-322(-)